MSGRPKKEFHEYITEPSSAHVGHENYLAAPATAFLTYAVEAKCAVDLCIKKFPKNNSRQYTKDSNDSLQHLVSAMLPSLMGHFETFQRYLFAGMFDRSVYLETFDAEDFLGRLSKEVAIDPLRLAAHRSLGVPSVGLLLADGLSGWHNPHKVNTFFNAFSLNRTLFSNDACSNLLVLWQLRHSIVHTGGTLTLPDAQKIPALSKFGNKKVVAL
jgi:hypothetical protein